MPKAPDVKTELHAMGKEARGTRSIGGLQMIDGGEADDKIIAVLSNDPIWGDVRTITEIPQTLVERLRHYFLTYKLRPGEPTSTEIYEVFQAEHAHKVIAAAMEDYVDEYGG